MVRFGEMLLANWRLVKELLETVDVALEVVDVRDPLSTRSKRFEKLCSGLGIKYVVVLNKSDLVPRDVVRAWIKYFEEVEGMRAVPISAQKRLGTLKLRKIIRRLSDKKPLIVGVFGMPKVGKSTLINTWAGRHAARTSPYPGTPGYTKKAQLFNVGGGVYLLDTPGIIPVEGDEIEVTIRMNPIDTIKNPVATAVGLIKRIASHNPKAFREAYGIDSSDPDIILRELAFKRGWVYKSDKEPVITESAKLIIRDYLDGKIRFYVLPP
ncbi:MAG: GTPase [Zestosphaera sp.]